MKDSAARQGWSAAVRALVCGYVDACAVLTLGVYAAFMTGNTTTGGVHVGQIRFTEAGHSLLPIPFFLFGVVTGTDIAQADERGARQRLSTLVGILLLVDIAATRTGCAEWFSITILSAGMGIVNTSVIQVGGQPVSLGFISGDVNNLAKLMAMGIRHVPAEQRTAS